MHLRKQITQPADPSYRLIVLTRGQVCKVDTADYEWLNQWLWFASFDKNTQSYYAKRNVPSINRRRQRIVSMAEIIQQPPDGHRVDHQNHDTLDNRRSNLRIASHQQNARNRRPPHQQQDGMKVFVGRKKKKKMTSARMALRDGR